MHQVFSSAQYLANSKYRVKSRTEIFYETLYSVKQMGNCFRSTYFGSIYCIRYNCNDCFDNMNTAEEQRKVLCSFFFLFFLLKSEKRNIKERPVTDFLFPLFTVIVFVDNMYLLVIILNRLYIKFSEVRYEYYFCLRQKTY